MEHVFQTLKSYNVDLQRGFLPTEDPLIELPSNYQVWEDLATNLSAYINAGVIRQKIDELSLIDHPIFNNQRELERAMLLLSFFAHAYVHAPPKASNYIPPSISIPWIVVAKQLERRPILSHSSAVLNNWKRIDTSKPIQLDNLATLCQFHGGLDESWFYLVTVEIEQVGAKGIPLMLQSIEYVKAGLWDQAANCLNQTNTVLKDILVSLKKMYVHCDPHIFYLRVRPFLASFENIRYEGTGLNPQSFHGGSAAQSSLLQFYDAVLGIEYESSATKNYLRLMREHMPKRHADFLQFVESTTNLRAQASKNKKLHSAYQEAIQHLINFRDEHLKFVALYIMKQAKKFQSTSTGTGGTNPMVFLKSVRDGNKSMLNTKL